MDQDDTRLQDEAYREFHTNDLVEEQRDSEDEDDMAYWDEEATLVAMMHTEWIYAHPILAKHMLTTSHS